MNDSGDRPCAREGHSVVLNGDQMILFGGMQQKYPKALHFSDCYKLHLKNMKWKKLKTKGRVPPMSYHASVLTKEHLIVWGGLGIGLYILRFSDLTWSDYLPSGHPISPRGGHTLILKEDVCYLFGGYFYGVYMNDMYTLEITKNSQKIIRVKLEGDVPTPRAFHGASLLGNKMYLFGGEVDDLGLTNELYEIRLPERQMHLSLMEELLNHIYVDVEFM